jgi:4-amino-4-deoxy-L-arabinose transferase-like glycosyltransferase
VNRAVAGVVRADAQRVFGWRGWRWALLGLVVGAYLLAELPYLDRYPLLNYDEGEEIAPAYKLATRGVFGSDMMAGFYHAETRVYYMLPLFLLSMGVVFRLLGTGIWQARLLSVACGLAAVLLTLVLGRALHNWSVGLLAAAVLCSVQLSLLPAESGVPFLDIARVVRYDVMVPAWGLLGCLSFVWAHERQRMMGYAVCGACIGLAALSNAYGLLYLPLVVLCLLWVDGLATLRSWPPYLIVLGCLLAALPWLLYVLSAPADYVGQMTIQSSRNRFDFLDPGFYWQNLLDERYRYAPLLGGRLSRPALWPRAGFWLVIVGGLAGLAFLARRLRRGRRLADVFIFLGFPLLALLLALTTNLKTFGYLALVLPALALQVSFGLVELWRALGPGRPLPRLALLAGLGLALVEGQAGVINNLEAGRAAIPYDAVLRPIAARLAPSDRILATHAFWLGLQPAIVLSMDLPFYFSNPAYDDENETLAEAMAKLNPKYILADSIVGATIRLPAAQDDPPLETDFWNYVAAHCAVALSLPVTEYGPLTLYQCAN